MRATGTMFRSLYTAVVVANDPMPSVSKNAVTNPIASCNGAGVASPPRATVTPQTSRTIPRPTNSRPLTSIHQLVGIGFRQIDGCGPHLLHRLGEEHVNGGRAAGCHCAVGGEHRHRTLQRVDVQRVVVAAH